MGAQIQLGKAAGKAGTSLLIKPKPKTFEERLALVEAQLKELQIRLAGENREEEAPVPLPEGVKLNKDGLPIDANFIGITNGEPYVLTVKEDGYHVGLNAYPSLSAAAEAVSGCRRSGWTFWKTLDGERDLKEAFKRR